MSAATLQPPRKRFTRDEVEQMLDAGLFAGQRFELIDGDLIDKMGQNPPHSYSLSLLLACLVKIFGVERVRMQQPSEAAPAERERSLPEPDLAVLAEVKDEYRRRHPRGDELLLAIEVADTTVRYDATTKRDLYARAGVPEYWVLDIPGRRLIVHRGLMQGQFEQIDTLPESAVVSAGGMQIPVSELLP
ncbi:MAG TPA: Uma2 family endonuclease [Bryobacteraceae bacterium]